MIIPKMIFFLILLLVIPNCPLVTNRKPDIKRCKENALELMVANEVLRNSRPSGNKIENTEKTYEIGLLTALQKYQSCENIGYKGLIDIK
jgi:hypothetical protein